MELLNEAKRRRRQRGESKWNYEADLDLLKLRLKNKAKRKTQRKVRNLITVCLRLTRRCELNKSATDCGEQEESQDVLADAIVAVSISHNNSVSMFNPFELDLILNKVFSFLPLNTLLTSRLVNQSWNSNAVSCIQKKSTKLVVVNSKDFPRFCSAFEKSMKHPVTKLKIVLNDSISIKSYPEFFNKHGSCLEELQIEQPYKYRYVSVLPDPAGKECLSNLQIILRKVPNVKSLSLDLGDMCKFLPGTFIFDHQEVKLSKVESLEISTELILSQGFLHSLFDMVPNTKILKVGNITEDQDWDIILRAIRNLNVQAMHGIWKDSQFRSLVQQRFSRLKQISMSIVQESLPNDQLELVQSREELLNFLSESLEVLCLHVQSFDRGHDHTVKFELPLMRNLKKVSVYLYECEFSIRIDPAHVPKLQTLSIDIDILRSHTFSEESTCPSLEEMYLTGIDHCDEPAILSGTGIRLKFPNLRKLRGLEIDMHPLEIASIVEELHKIEDLEIKIVHSTHGDMRNFNYVVSGIPADSGWALNQLKYHIGFESMLAWINPLKPSLRELKRLKKLVITFDARKVESSYVRKVESSYVSIDEIGVNFTFLRMSPKISLTFRGDFSISDNLAGMLKKHYHNICFAPTPTEIEKPEHKSSEWSDSEDSDASMQSDSESSNSDSD